MNTRHITLTVGAAAGGMLAAAFLSTAAASAQPGDNDFVTDPFGLTPTGDADLTASGGAPPIFETAYGTQTFDFNGSEIASFLTSKVPDDIDLSDVTYDNATLDVANTSFFGGGLTNQEIVLPRDFDFGPDHGDFTLHEGSVFDVSNYGLGFGDVYVDLVNPDGDNQIYDEVITPFGNFDISPLAQGFDAAAFQPSDLADLDPSAGLDFSGGLF
jgi:hypothetical protein